MLEPATQQYWLTVAAAFLACEVLYHASHFAINKTATSLNATDRATLALKVVNIVHAALSGPVAFYFLFRQGDPDVDHAVQRAIALDANFAPQLFSAHIAADQALSLTCWTVGFMVLTQRLFRTFPNFKLHRRRRRGAASPRRRRHDHLRVSRAATVLRRSGTSTASAPGRSRDMGRRSCS